MIVPKTTPEQSEIWAVGYMLGDEYEVLEHLERTRSYDIYLAIELKEPKDKVIIKRLRPDKVHVFLGGRIVRSGGPEQALELEARGYEWLEQPAPDTQREVSPW